MWMEGIKHHGKRIDVIVHSAVCLIKQNPSCEPFIVAGQLECAGIKWKFITPRMELHDLIIENTCWFFFASCDAFNWCQLDHWKHQAESIILNKLCNFCSLSLSLSPMAKINTKFLFALFFCDSMRCKFTLQFQFPASHDGSGDIVNSRNIVKRV